jgi:NodT family efflux transporter outer membrane factor (OMF) lipoprotein
MEVACRSILPASIAKQRPATAHRTRRGAVLLVLGLLLLAGCTTNLRQWAAQGFKVGPEYDAPGAFTSDRWIDTHAPQVNAIETRDGDWWTVFNDPILDDLIATASQENLGVREAGARILEARARLAIARGSLLPQTQEAFGFFTRTQMSRTTAKPIKVPYFDDWATGFNASWELDFWGRFRREVEASEADVEAAVEDCRDVLVILQAEVAAAYLQTRVAQERIALAKRNVELQESTLALAELRFREGKTTKLDVTQAQENLAATQALVPQLEIALRESHNALCVLLAVPPYHLDAELGFAPIPEAPSQVAVGIPAQLLARRPDVRRAERLLAAQSARIGIAESDLYPRIAITGTIGYESMNLPTLFQGNSLIGNVGPGFRWNILNYGRILNNVRAEEARLEQLALRYQDVVLKANQEVENGINRFLREQERVRFLEQGVKAASESVELAETQYRIGTVDFQRLVDSQRALVQLQDQLTAARGQVVTSLVAVYKALGGGWQPTTASGPAGGSQPLPPPESEQAPKTP